MDPGPQALLLAHAGATLAMVGVIWTIQLVHYPLMAQVGPERFAAYEAAHAARITWVVMPLMLAEIACAGLLAVSPPAGVERWITLAGAALVLVIWVSTALVQVPLHARLALGFDAEAHAELVSTNWVRTVAWTLRGAIAIGLLASQVKAGAAVGFARST